MVVAAAAVGVGAAVGAAVGLAVGAGVGEKVGCLEFRCKEKRAPKCVSR